MSSSFSSVSEDMLCSFIWAILFCLGTPEELKEGGALDIHPGRATLFAALLHCLWGRHQRGNSAAHLLVPSALLDGLLCETGSFSHCSNCHINSESQFPLKSAPPSKPLQPLTRLQPALPPRSPDSQQFFSASQWHLTGLVVLIDFFFNSLVVRVPCSLIFWCFWLFIDFRLVVILFWLCEEAKGFYLCLHLGWKSNFLFFNYN